MPTALELQQGRQALRPADYGVVHPQLSGIRTRRGVGQSAAEYYEHMVDTRRSINTLMRAPVGEQMLRDINARTAAVNPGLHGTARNPLTAVDIHSGRHEVPDSQMSQRPRLDPMNPIASAQRAFRYDGLAGAGQASRVNYNEMAPSANRFVSLGHEMVHAWRAAHGVGVSAPQVAPRRGDPLLNPPTDPIVGNVVAHTTHMREEFETVGLLPTPNLPLAPTENRLRAEHARPARPDYSGLTPHSPGYLNPIRNIDEATDTRNWFQKNVFGTPSPIQNLMHHLTG